MNSACLLLLACLAYANAGVLLNNLVGGHGVGVIGPIGYKGIGIGGIGLGGIGLGGIGYARVGVLGGYPGGCTPLCARQYVLTGHCGSGCGGCGSYLGGVCSPVCVKQYIRVGHCGSSCGSCGSVLGTCLGGVGLGVGLGGLGLGGVGLGGVGLGIGGLGVKGVVGPALGLGIGPVYGAPGLGHGLGIVGPGYGIGINRGVAGAAAASAKSSASASSRRASRRRGEFEQTVTTRVKKTVECEKECRRSKTCQRQWAVAHSYWGSCSQCKTC